MAHSPPDRNSNVVKHLFSRKQQLSLGHPMSQGASHCKQHFCRMVGSKITYVMPRAGDLAREVQVYLHT